MAFTNIATSPIVQSGLTFATVACDATNGNVVDVGWRVFLYLENTGGSSATVTIAVPGTQDGLTIGPRAITLAAGAKRLVGPLAPNLYSQPYGTTDAGRAHITYSASAAVSVGVFSI